MPFFSNKLRTPKTRRLLAGWVLLAVLFSLVSQLVNLHEAHALTVTPVPQPTTNSPVWLKSHQVNVEIDNQLAVTKIDQILYNSASRDMEAVYLFPVPIRSAISDFSMYVDGKKLEAQILDKNQARTIYEGIVREQRDPALLEYANQGVVKVSIYPIPANGEKRIQIQYNQVLKAESGLAEYSYPLALPQFSNRSIPVVSVNMKIRSKDGLKALYSPSHSIKIDRKGANEATISYSEQNARPDRDFRFFYGAGDGDFSLNFMTYRDMAESGNNGNYFLLLVTPKVSDKIDTKQVVAKDVLLVLDTSGSMEGEKIGQARKALLAVLDALNPQDRFNIVTFSTNVRSFADTLQTMERRADAREWVERILATGGTNINDALLTALKQADESRQSNRPQTVIFMTDGQATNGETKTDKILSNVAKNTAKEIRLFCFGVGYDVNTTLLDGLASQNRGTSDYVKPNEDVEEKVSQLYSRISQPVLTNLSLEFSGITMEDYYPNPLTDLFFGSQMVLTGRFYPKSGQPLPKQTNITLKGYANGQAVSFEYKDVDLSGSDDSRSFIPRLWAGRKVGNLLTQIQASPNAAGNKELIDEVTRLSVKYGIITPYTSFLVREDTPQPIPASGGVPAGATTAAAAATTAAAAAPADARYQATAAATVAAAAATAPVSGAGAVNNSSQNNNLANGNTVPTAAPAATRTGNEANTASIKYAGDKTFILKQGIWVDSSFDGKAPLTRIAFGSELYFKLLQEHPDWGKYFAVGNSVLVVLEGKAYQVGATGETQANAGATVAPATTPAPNNATNPTPVSGNVTPGANNAVINPVSPTAVSNVAQATPGAQVAANSPTTSGDNSGLVWLVVIGLLVVAGAGGWFALRRKAAK